MAADGRGGGGGGGERGVSPKALSLMPAQQLGEGGNSAVLPSLGQVVTSKSDTLEAEISTSLSLSPHPIPRHPSETRRMTSALLSALDRNRLRFLACAGSDRRRTTCRTRLLHHENAIARRLGGNVECDRSCKTLIFISSFVVSLPTASLYNNPPLFFSTYSTRSIYLLFCVAFRLSNTATRSNYKNRNIVGGTRDARVDDRRPGRGANF